MKHHPNRHERRSLRLRDYDYRRDGYYFVTICVDDREPRLGRIVDGRVEWTEAGRMVRDVWADLPRHYSGVDLDAYVIMPDHIHGIVVLTDDVGATPRGCPSSTTPASANDTGQARNSGQAQGPAPTNDDDEPLSLPDVVHRFKSLTTRRYIHGVRHHGWPPFDRRLWQRNYDERVIRNEAELAQIRVYIRTNPCRERLDE